MNTFRIELKSESKNNLIDSVNNKNVSNESKKKFVDKLLQFVNSLEKLTFPTKNLAEKQLNFFLKQINKANDSELIKLMQFNIIKVF